MSSRFSSERSRCQFYGTFYCVDHIASDPAPPPPRIKIQVNLPFCDATQYSTCIVEKETLGLYYGFIDAFLVVLLLAGYYWVCWFNIDEFEVIKKNTVTAAGTY